MLKNYNTYFQYLIILWMISFSSCVNDDSFFPEENTGDIVSSSSLVTILNNFNSEANFLPEEEQCFRFVYPVTLGYNTDSTIRVDNYDGLVAAVSSQGTNFNITGLQFPVDIVFNTEDSIRTILDEETLLNVVNECNINTFRDDFDQFFNTCFGFQYPVTLLDIEGEEVTLSSDQEFQIFYESQPVVYQPNFKFPIQIVNERDEVIIIDTFFGFYQALEMCDIRCPQLNFDVEMIDPFTLEYLFTASFSNLEDTEGYEWFIDDEFIEMDGPRNDGDNMLIFSFDEPGQYEVCIMAETPDCPEGISFCELIDVPEFCPDLFFETVQEMNTSVYTWTASLEGIEALAYQWFIDDQFIEEDGGVSGDNMLSSELSLGTHEVCIRAVTSSCPEGIEFAKK